MFIPHNKDGQILCAPCLQQGYGEVLMEYWVHYVPECEEHMTLGTVGLGAHFP